MKYYTVFVFLMFTIVVFGQNYAGIGRIIPGQKVLNIAYNSTSITSAPQEHAVQFSFIANPEIVITFVHVNVFPVIQYRRISFMDHFI